MNIPPLATVMQNHQPQINFIAIVGIGITIATFGINQASGYAKLEARLAVIEERLTNVREAQIDNSAAIKRIENPNRK